MAARFWSKPSITRPSRISVLTVDSSRDLPPVFWTALSWKIPV
jgi:hypothetical protein